MRWVLYLMMLASLGFAPAPFYRPTPSEKELALLQGKWTFVSSKNDDLLPTPEEGRFIVVSGCDFEFQYGGGNPMRSYRIEFAITPNKRTLTLHEKDRAFAGIPHRGLYRIAGDEFVFCFGTTRGTLATSLDGGRGMRRLVFQRAPKP